jgi:hypothetical protein
MVKITNISGRPLSRRTPRGHVVRWMEGSTVEVTSERLLAELDASNAFARQDEIGKETGGGGLKTHVRPSKRLGRPPKSRKHLDKGKQAAKEKVKPPKSVIDKVKKPKGLKKKKGIGIDLDGDGKVDVVVGDD